MNDQAVGTETDATPKAVVEASDAPDLDALLSEYDEGTKVEQQPTKDTDRVSALEQRLMQVETRGDMKSAVAAVRGDLDVETFDDGFLESYLNNEANKDPRITKAWVNRHTNPKGFEKIMKGMGRKLNDKFNNIPDKNVTDDTDAIVAAVRGASTNSPRAEETPDYSKMSDSDFTKMVMEMDL